MPANEDMWPSGLTTNLPRTPKGILQAQASRLGIKTSYLVTATVDVRAHVGSFLIDFDIQMPSLRYSYTLFTLRYDVGLYPVTILDCSPDVGYSPTDSLADEGALERFLAAVLGSKSTLRLVRSLVAQAKQKKEDDEAIPF